MAGKNHNNMGNTLRSLGNMTGDWFKDITDMIGEVQQTGQVMSNAQKKKTQQDQKSQYSSQAKNTQNFQNGPESRQMRDRSLIGRRNEVEAKKEVVRDAAGNIIHSPYELNDYDEEKQLLNGYARQHTDEEVYKRQNGKHHGYNENSYDDNDYDEVDVNVKEPLFDKGNKKQLKRAMIYKEVLGRPKGW